MVTQNLGSHALTARFEVIVSTLLFFLSWKKTLSFFFRRPLPYVINRTSYMNGVMGFKTATVDVVVGRDFGVLLQRGLRIAMRAWHIRGDCIHDDLFIFLYTSLR